MHITILIQVSAHKHQHTCSFHPIIQDPQMLDQLAKNITRCGLSNSTLNYLRVSKMMFILLLIFQFNPNPRLKWTCSILLTQFFSFSSLKLCVILEPMQELMSRHKTYSLSPRDCLKTCLFQKWQRMVAPPGKACNWNSAALYLRLRKNWVIIHLLLTL